MSLHKPIQVYQILFAFVIPVQSPISDYGRDRSDNEADVSDLESEGLPFSPQSKLHMFVNDT